ncbi:MAG: pilus assembly protein TadG-related protein [Acidimicrobiales bacterium]|nr:pilus assembly protein TadG-related protein [Acidimicrobiales bacterium]
MSLILFAATIGTLLLFVALVIDLGRARSQDQVNDSVVDDAALAGAANIGDEGDAQVACEAAWAYVKANIAQPGFSLAPDCSQLAGACSASTARTASVDIDRQRYTFVHPVPTDHQLMGSQPTGDESATDAGCRRFGVMVTDVSENIFQQGEIDLASSAVAMQDVTSTSTGGGGGSPSSLVLLDPTGCLVLQALQGGHLTVHDNEGIAGSVHVDSDASGCNGNQPVIKVDGGASINADAVYRVATGDDAVDTPHWQPPPTWDQPVDEPHLRQPADDTWGPAIESLHDRWAAGSGAPEGFRLWSAYIDANHPQFSDECNINNPNHIVVPADDWYINCPDGLRFTGSGRVAFQGGNLVMEGPIRGENSIPVAMNCASGSLPARGTPAEVASACGAPNGDSVVVARNGRPFVFTGGSGTAWQQTFAYAPNGTISMGQGNSIHWTAPLGGDFADLLFWSESSEPIVFEGGSSLNHLEGTFFAPNAPMRVRQGGSLELRGAQFFLHSFDIRGGATVDLYPDPDRNLPPDGGSTTTESDGVSLIR